MSAAEPGLVLLLRHRAVLFGLLGAALLGAAAVPALAPLAIGGGLVSTLAFLALAWPWPAHAPPIRRVVRVDVVAIGGLVLAAIADLAARA